MPTSSSKKHRDDPENSVGSTDDQLQASPESTDLTQLVWKHFEDEIRQTLIEVEESLSNEKVNPQHEVRKRKQEGK